jgi:hypothetical protein
VTKLNIAGITMIPVKIGMNSQTRLTKNAGDSREATARTSVPAYSAIRTSTLRASAAARSSSTRLSSFARASMRWSSPGCSVISSLNSAWRRIEAPPRIVFSTKLPLRRLPMQPHGQRPTSASSSHCGVPARSLRRQAQFLQRGATPTGPA